MSQNPPATPTRPPKGVCVATVAYLEPQDCAVRSRWTYDAADSYAVTLSLFNRSSWVDWRFARELLAAGLRMPAGDGDVHLTLCFEHHLLMRLDPGPPQSAALFVLDASDAERLLHRSYQLVPLGAEVVDCDALLSALLPTQPDPGGGGW